MSNKNCEKILLNSVLTVEKPLSNNYDGKILFDSNWVEMSFEGFESQIVQPTSPILSKYFQTNKIPIIFNYILLIFSFP